MDVFDKCYYQLVETLPMRDAGFISQLYSRKLFPKNLKEEVDAKPTRAEKAAYLLDHGIKPGVRKDFMIPFQELLSVVNESNNRKIEQLAIEISGKFDIDN